MILIQNFDRALSIVPGIRQAKDGTSAKITADGILLAVVAGLGISELEFELIDVTR